MKKVVGFIIGGVVGSLLGIGVMSIKKGSTVNDDDTIEDTELEELEEKGEDEEDEAQ